MKPGSWILAAVVVLALALVVAVMLWPAAQVSEVEIVVTDPEAGAAAARGSGSARRRADPAGVDAGAAPAVTGVPAEAIFARFGWGAGADQLGRERPAQGNPEGPMSLTLDRQGGVVVLDQVNQRLVRLDRSGAVTGTTPLSVRGAQDVAVAADGTTLVLDRVLDKSVSLIGPDGKPKGELPLEGKNFPEGGGATGVFTHGEDVYVEREHGDLVKLGTTSGAVDRERAEVPGRISRDGSVYLTAGIAEPGEERVYVGAIEAKSRQQRFQREYRLGAPVIALTLLDTDGAGIIYLGAMTAREAAAGRQASIELLCLDPLDGRPLGRAQLPANSGGDETFKEMVVADQGGVLYLVRTEKGATLQKYDCTR